MLLFHELVTTYLRILFYLPQGLAVCILAFFSSYESLENGAVIESRRKFPISFVKTGSLAM